MHELSALVMEMVIVAPIAATMLFARATYRK